MKELIERYVRAAAAHGRATEAADAAQANAAADEIARCWVALRLRTDDWFRVFAALLDHDDPSVRLWAASHVIHREPERAIAVLESLSRRSGLLGFSAEQTLAVWRRGELNEA